MSNRLLFCRGESMVDVEQITFCRGESMVDVEQITVL